MLEAFILYVTISLFGYAMLFISSIVAAFPALYLEKMFNVFTYFSYWDNVFVIFSLSIIVSTVFAIFIISAKD